MSQQLINLGSVANDGTGSPLRTGGQDINANFTELYAAGIAQKTVNASTYTGGSPEAQITAAIADAVSRSMLYVYIPASMLPYSCSSVTYNTAVRLIREGGDPTTWDVEAYGADATRVGDATLGVLAAIAGAQAAGGGRVYCPRTYRVTANIVVPIMTTGSIILEGAGERSSYFYPEGAATIGILFGSATADASGTTTSNTQYCGMRNLSVSGVNMSGSPIGVQFTQMQKGFLENVIIEAIPGTTGIGLYLLGSTTTGGLGAAASPHTWRCRFTNVLVTTTRRPLVLQNADENDFYNCNFGVTTGLGAITADSVFAIEFRQGHNDRFYGTLCSGDDSNLTPNVAIYLRAPINAAGAANGDNIGHQFYGVVAEGFDRIVWQEASANTHGNKVVGLNPSIYNTLLKDDGTQLGRALQVEAAVLTAPVNYYSARAPYCDALTFANGATTPAVSGGNCFSCNNGSPTTITNFTNDGSAAGVSGQVIVVRMDANTTIQHNSNIHCPGTADIVGAANKVAIFANFGGAWYCTGLSAN